MDGKSWGLLGVLRDYRGAVEYDISTRFPGRCPRGLRSVGDTITLAEMARLVEILRSDPSSALASAVEGWDHPVSREAAVLMDLWDLTAAATGAKKPPRYERPWKEIGQRAHVGDAAGVSTTDAKARLAAARDGDVPWAPV